MGWQCGLPRLVYTHSSLQAAVCDNRLLYDTTEREQHKLPFIRKPLRGVTP
jgi:hypothetical protein